MGRKKYDINLKPNPYVKGTYLVRFTSQDALNDFTNVCAAAGIIKPGIVAYYLNEWKPITAEQFNLIQYGVWNNCYSSIIKYASINDFEHGLTT